MKNTTKKKQQQNKQTRKKNKIEMSSAVTMICALRVNRKCPKISYTKVSYSADPDQAAPSEAIWSGSVQLVIPLSSLWNNCINNKI